MIYIELEHDVDALVRRERISNSLSSRKSRGLSNPGQSPHRLTYPEKTLKDIRIESGMTVGEIWKRLNRRAELFRSNDEQVDVYSPNYATSIYWTERHGSQRLPVIRAFADVYGIPEDRIEQALLVPLKYKKCRTVRERWELAEQNGWTVLYEVDGTRRGDS